MKLAVALLWPATLLAHMVSMSTSEATVDGNRIHYELRMPTYEVANIPNPGLTLLDHIHFASGGSRGRMVQKNCGDRNGTYTCTADYEFPAEVDGLEIECTFTAVTVPNHVHMLRAYKGDKVDQAVFDISFTHADVRFRPPSAWETAVHESGAGFFRAVGGLAPLLFLVGLVLAARGRLELGVLAIAFVVGEALACGIANRMPFALSPRFIEAAAALTIAYLGFEIVLLPKSGQRWLVVGVLGLIHGTYFSLFLISSRYRFWTFMGGVVAAEILTIAVLAAGVKLLLNLIRTPRAVPMAASLLLAVGMVWFVVRLRA